jgi:hypothetical protein
VGIDLPRCRDRGHYAANGWLMFLHESPFIENEWASEEAGEDKSLNAFMKEYGKILPSAPVSSAYSL